MKRVLYGMLLAATLSGLGAGTATAAGLTLTIRDGRVSLDAKDVTIRQILTEWARVGKTRIVNVERVTSGPVTLKFDNVPEPDALELVLRALPGYVAAPRSTPVADASMYDRILIMATTTAIAAPATGPGSRLQTGLQQPPSNFTQLRMPGAPLSPGVMPQAPVDANETTEAAIAAAAAAGLVTVPAPAPATPGLRPFGDTVRTPGAVQPTGSATPATPTSTNPFGASTGTALPGTAPPPPVATPAPIRSTLAPPQADQ